VADPALLEELRLHMSDPFPRSVVRGEDYGEADAVMIGADIYGWASRSDSLNAGDRVRLRRAADELERSLSAFPVEARPYYGRVLRIAHLALGAA
jgi:hypothetical protein